MHAVVSQDSDCFAYGAKQVYRNFSVSSSGGGGAGAGSVDCYDAEKMYASNGELYNWKTIIFFVLKLTINIKQYPVVIYTT